MEWNVKCTERAKFVTNFNKIAGVTMLAVGLVMIWHPIKLRTKLMILQLLAQKPLCISFPMCSAHLMLTVVRRYASFWILLLWFCSIWKRKRKQKQKKTEKKSTVNICLSTFLTDSHCIINKQWFYFFLSWVRMYVCVWPCHAVADSVSKYNKYLHTKNLCHNLKT